MDQNSITLEQRLSFLNALELPPAPPAGEKKAPVSQDEMHKPACVDAGQIVAFAKDVSAKEQADILNSCLLAQLAASKKFSREEDIKNWYNFYSDVLTHCGWTMGGTVFDEYKSSSQSFGIDTFMIDLLRAMASGNLFETAQKAIVFLRSLKDNDPRSRIFSHSSHSGKNGNFQLSTCFHDSNVLMMSLGCSYFSASNESESIFFLSFESSNSHIYSSKQNIMLNLDVYDAIRDFVIAKLADRAQQYIQDLEI